jgi:hypothetical protein
MAPTPTRDVSAPQPADIKETQITELPSAGIMIETPGQGSAVVSPVQIRGESDPTFEQNLVIQLSDESGIVLAEKPVTIQSEYPERGRFETSLEFSVPAMQTGRLSVYETSAKDGGLIRLESVHVILLPDGHVPEIQQQPFYPYPEPIQIDAPVRNQVYSGGKMTVSGYASVGVFESTLGVVLCGGGCSGESDVLCGTRDNVLGQGYAMLVSEMGQPGAFSGEIAYTVNGPKHARLAVYIASMRDGGIERLTSVPVLLK